MMLSKLKYNLSSEIDVYGPNDINWAISMAKSKTTVVHMTISLAHARISSEESPEHREKVSCECPVWFHLRQYTQKILYGLLSSHYNIDKRIPNVKFKLH